MMEHITQTPFGRTLTAGVLANQALASADLSVPEHDKWQLFRTICAARERIGVSDRDLAVLNALLTFYPGDSLADGQGIIVFPSNDALSERAHGMPESTLRRHLAALVHAALILRHDSPNGKRYAARGAGGEVTRAFGFSLRPLLVRAAEFAQAAIELRSAKAALKRDREACVLLLRDATQLVAYGQEQGLSGLWAPLEDQAALARRRLRRRLTADQLSDLRTELTELLDRVHDMFGPDENKTEKMSGNDVDIERHYHNSNQTSYESEPRQEKGGGQPMDPEETMGPVRHDEPSIPIAVVLKACPDVKDFVDDDIRQWHHLVAAAMFLRGMMGISEDAWREAERHMGSATAAVVVVCILQRMSHIHSPGGYLRSLSRKAEQGAFSPGPMVMALLNGSNEVAA